MNSRPGRLLIVDEANRSRLACRRPEQRGARTIRGQSLAMRPSPFAFAGQATQDRFLRGLSV